MSCWDDIDDNNYVEYRATANGDWQPSGFCETCVSYLLKTQWDLYTSALAKTTCKAEQRRLLKAGPPVNLKDAKALPCPDEGEVHSLWFKSDSAEHSAKLEGSLTGEVRYAVMQNPSSTHLLCGTYVGASKVLGRPAEVLCRGRA
jgi:hypothetical protein